MGKMKSIKKYHIPALFGKEFFTEGFTIVPNLLLRYSTRLSLSANDLLILLLILYFQQSGKKEVTGADIASFLGIPEKQVTCSLESLQARGFIAVDQGEIDITGVFEKIADYWAEEKVEKWQETGGKIFPARDRARNSSPLVNLFNVFEQEFGRPLTPIECEQIMHWCKDIGYSEELVLEALKRAVLRGVFNLTYIDRILSRWARNNLRTTQEVIQYEEKHFAQRKAKKEKFPQESSRGKEKDEKYKDLYM
ncbi:MAG TPA: hypothetical protein DCE07_07090 [Peptococcaceae bacterium]|nr:hypothetical protein [Peptococcaceae bacterium]